MSFFARACCRTRRTVIFTYFVSSTLRSAGHMAFFTAIRYGSAGNNLCTARSRGGRAVECPVIGLALILTVSTGAAAQSPEQTPAPPPTQEQAPVPAPTEPAPVSVFRSGASLVALNVTVTDGKRLVPDLRPDDFAVYEDGVLQRVQFFEARQVPIDLILLLDTSSSMSDKMAVVHEAAIGFLKTLRDTDRGAVVGFGDNVRILQPLTSDRTALEQAVRRASPRGSTALYNALYVAMKEFGRIPQEDGVVRRQAIAVLSDGEDTSSIIPFDDVLAMARKSGIN